MDSSMALFSSLILMMLSLTFSEANAREILVGGKVDAWKIPTSAAETLNHWAEATRFKIGDWLIWKYDPKQDSVVEVTKENYDKCNTSNPIAEYKDGNSKVKLNRSGPFYFISGAQWKCQKGEKLIVVVLSPNHNKPKPSPPPLAPSPSTVDPKAPTPSPVDPKAPTPSPVGPDPSAPTAMEVGAPAPAPVKNGGAGGWRNGVITPLVVFGSLVGMALF
ncbi:hypothetical protein NE237_027505 [Protea cynaroides]|uniref:Phytocyanin domain-containing protein n=1 Tax=Protea cynaroides TaxID=273540 RepID=A0A9Q0JUG1_9MAGN|nr:hypothetical protein NE237_027505 [Protea cynaroides]